MANKTLTMIRITVPSNGYATTLADLPWAPCRLSASENASVQNFMEATGYSYGRIDFLRDAQGLWFLEVNPNGQFAWLDPKGENGLLVAVANAIQNKCMQRHGKHRAPNPSEQQAPV